MEQHPVPQNVTSFQFRLIGDMTLKQFGFLAAGAILGYICYTLPIPKIFTIPLAGAFGLLGFGMAFVPVEERPMDVWVLSFLRSIYSPTLYVWQREKQGGQISTQTPPPQPVIAHPNFTTPPPDSDPSKKESGTPEPLYVVHPKATVLQPAAPPPAVTTPQITPLNPSQKSSLMRTIAVWFGIKPAAAKHTNTQIHQGQTTVNQPSAAATPGPTQPTIAVSTSQSHVQTLKTALTDKLKVQSEPPTKTEIHPDMTLQPQEKPTPLQITEEKLEEETPDQKQIQTLEDQQKNLEQQLHDSSLADSRILDLQKKLTDVLSEKNRLESEVVTLRTQLTTSPMPEPKKPIPSFTTVVHSPTTPTVKVINPSGAIKAGLPRLTTFPNVVTGIIKDCDNNLLPGVLVTVRDKEGVPLRALKTNKLGQFAASTPLPNNTYVVEIEDPRNRYIFDRAQITLEGQVLPAIEIIAKSQKEIQREKLAKEIFNKEPI